MPANPRYSRGIVLFTVNFDDPSSCHLYSGDETGRPSTALTSFAGGDLPTGRNGNGMAVETAFVIPIRSVVAISARSISASPAACRSRSPLTIRVDPRWAEGAARPRDQAAAWYQPKRAEIVAALLPLT
jgi:hypothetical protein